MNSLRMVICTTRGVGHILSGSQALCCARPMLIHFRPASAQQDQHTHNLHWSLHGAAGCGAVSAAGMHSPPIRSSGHMEGRFGSLRPYGPCGELNRGALCRLVQRFAAGRGSAGRAASSVARSAARTVVGGPAALTNNVTVHLACRPVSYNSRAPEAYYYTSMQVKLPRSWSS